MKNKNKSFADEGKRLIKLYSRASFDKNERQELDAALQKLSEEQELYKQVNKIGEYSDEAMAQKAMQQQEMLAQQSQGQVPQGQPMQPDSQFGQMIGQPQEPQQFWDGGPFKIPTTASYLDNMYKKNTVNNYDYASKYSGLQNVANANRDIMAASGNYMPIGAVVQEEAATQPVVGQDQQIGQTQSILPSVIAGGIGMIGNSLLAAGVKNNQFKQSYGADQISLAKERERLSREATTARNIGMRNLSGAGSRGAYLAGAGNVSAGVNQQLGDALSQSYFKEGLTNLQQREKAAELNRQVAIMNYQAKVNADNERKGYLAAAAGIPAQVMQDIGNINYQNSALLSSGTDNYIAGVNGKSSPWKSQQIYRKFNK